LFYKWPESTSPEANPHTSLTVPSTTGTALTHYQNNTPFQAITPTTTRRTYRIEIVVRVFLNGGLFSVAFTANSADGWFAIQQDNGGVWQDVTIYNPTVSTFTPTPDGEEETKGWRVDFEAAFASSGDIRVNFGALSSTGTSVTLFRIAPYH
jgi:hypothetical protein